jgi:plastocyanin
MLARSTTLRRSTILAVFVALAATMTLIVAGTPIAAASDTQPVVLLGSHCGATTGMVMTLADPAPSEQESATTGSAGAIPVDMIVGRIDRTLQSLLASDHVLAVQTSHDQADRSLACGDIGGIVRDGQLVMGLGEENDSGYSGVAILSPDGAGTTVILYLMQHSGVQPTLAAEAPLPAVTVDIKGFAYNPGTVEVPAGGSVTWTNEDNAPHTVTGLNGAIPQSGAMPFGATFTQEFTTPGAYDYICAYHPNMKGTVVVK